MEIRTPWEVGVLCDVHFVLARRLLLLPAPFAHRIALVVLQIASIGRLVRDHFGFGCISGMARVLLRLGVCLIDVCPQSVQDGMGWREAISSCDRHCGRETSGLTSLRCKAGQTIEMHFTACCRRVSCANVARGQEA